MIALFIGFLGGVMPAASAVLSPYRSGLFQAFALPTMVSIAGVVILGKPSMLLPWAAGTAVGALFLWFATKFAAWIRPPRSPPLRLWKFLILACPIGAVICVVIGITRDVGITIPGSMLMLSIWPLAGYLARDWSSEFFLDPVLQGMKEH